MGSAREDRRTIVTPQMESQTADLPPTLEALAQEIERIYEAASASSAAQAQKDKEDAREDREDATNALLVVGGALAFAACCTVM